MIENARDGTVTLIDDANPARRKVLAPGADLSSECLAFFGPPPLPEEVPMNRVLKYLDLLKFQTGLDLEAQIEAYLESMPEPARSLAKRDWQRAANLVVNSPLAQGAKAALGLSDDQFRTWVLAANALI